MYSQGFADEVQVYREENKVVDKLGLGVVHN